MPIEKDAIDGLSISDLFAIYKYSLEAGQQWEEELSNQEELSDESGEIFRNPKYKQLAENEYNYWENLSVDVASIIEEKIKSIFKE